jgi:hypothetical protein
VRRCVLGVEVGSFGTRRIDQKKSLHMGRMELTTPSAAVISQPMTNLPTGHFTVSGEPPEPPCTPRTDGAAVERNAAQSRVDPEGRAPVLAHERQLDAPPSPPSASHRSAGEGAAPELDQLAAADGERALLDLLGHGVAVFLCSALVLRVIEALVVRELVQEDRGDARDVGHARCAPGDVARLVEEVVVDGDVAAHVAPALPGSGSPRVGLVDAPG